MQPSQSGAPSKGEIGETAAQRRRPEHPLVPAGRVTGVAVYGREGDKLGKVEDLAIEKVSGQVAYALLSFGGLFGMGERVFPVPWKLLTYDTGRHGYVVPLEKAQIEDAPSFEPHELSGWDDAHWRDRIYDYYTPFGFPPI